MKCPFCGYTESKVIDSRPAEESTTIRRRRECLACQKRFTTYEIIERLPLVVVKRDGTHQEFDRSKLERSIRIACAKRPIEMAAIRGIVDEIENELAATENAEVSFSRIGNLVMKKLVALDQVAYVRFASVYRDFKDVDEFSEELRRLTQ